MATLSLLVLAMGTLWPFGTTEELVGKIVPPFPAGMEDFNGACVGATLATQCDVSISTLLKGEEPVLVWAGKRQSVDANGKAKWLVTDAIDHPTVGKGDWLSIGSCRYDGKDDTTIIAVAQIPDPEANFLKVKSWAYRLDRASGKFEELDASKVDCHNTTNYGD